MQDLDTLPEAEGRIADGADAVLPITADRAAVAATANPKALASTALPWITAIAPL
jgi:hypothetical protein